MKPKRVWAFLVLALALAVAVGAPALAAQEDVAREDTFRIAIGGQQDDPTNLNLYAGASRSDTGLHQVVYEYFFYNNLQTGEFIPWLAESMEYNDDYSALTVTLRDGVTWSDGEPFTTADVAFTYDLLRENPAMEWASEANDRVASVEAVDDLNAVFNLSTPNPRFHLVREAFPAVGIWGGLTILPQHIWEGQDPMTFLNSDPIGTGPYVLTSSEQNGLIYELRDDYWGEAVFGHTPGPQQLEFVYLGDEQTVALALSSNDLDVATIGILSAGTFQQIASENPAVSAWTAELPYAWADPCPRALLIQNATAPLDNADVRWAISSLIDRQAIVDLAYEGTTVPAAGIWPNYDANAPYFDAIADLSAEYPADAYDTARAEELLAAAGVTPGDVTLRYVVNSDSVEQVNVSAVLSDQLSAAGFNVDIQQLQTSVLEQTILAGDYDIYLQAMCPGYIAENLELFHSKFYVELGQPAPWYERNSFRYQNPELDAIIDQMLALPPEQTEELTALFQQAMAIWLPDLPVIPIVQAPALVPFNSTYWQGWPTAENAWNMPVSWWATFNLVLNGYMDQESGEWVGGIQPAGS